MTGHPLSGARVVVIGASGFLGARLVERLVVECGAQVRVLVRRVMGAATISRFPVQIAVGDVTSTADLRAALEGCHVVFNCARGRGADALQRRAVDVDGPRLVVEAAAAVGARVVHVSTMAVYDRPSDGDFDERSPSAPPGDAYADAKLAGERAALDAGARLGTPVTVVQPTAIYGPHAGVYGSEILEAMRTNRLILVDGGIGICNAVYVDDVVTGLLLAATTDAAAGERLLVSGAEHPTWREFFHHFEQMLGAPRTVSLSAADALDLWRKSSRRPWLLPDWVRMLRENAPVRRRLLATREGALVRSLANRVISPEARAWFRTPPTAEPTSGIADLPIAAERPWVVQNMARRARARIDKARTLLGYSPAFSLDDGMRLTGEWARWAGLAPERPAN